MNGLCSPQQGNIVMGLTTNFVVTSTGPINGGRIGPTIPPCSINGNVTVQRFIAPGVADCATYVHPFFQTLLTIGIRILL